MQTSFDINFSELPHPIAPSFLMDYHNPLMAYSHENEQLRVVYIVDDHDDVASINDIDGMGEIYTSHRSSSTHREMQETLGLDRDWEPDLERVIAEHSDRFRERWVETAISNSEFRRFVFQNADSILDVSAETLRDEAERVCPSNEPFLEAFSFTDKVLESLWTELRSEGRIGNPDAVFLDCYEHTGIHFSIASDGSNADQFDTSQRCAVWVLDDVTLEALEMRLNDNHDPSVTRRSILVDMARESLRVHNAYMNGEIYGVVDAAFVFDNESEEWELVDEHHDASFGIATSEAALEVAEDVFSEMEDHYQPLDLSSPKQASAA